MPPVAGGLGKGVDAPELLVDGTKGPSKFVTTRFNVAVTPDAATVLELRTVIAVAEELVTR